MTNSEYEPFNQQPQSYPVPEDYQQGYAQYPYAPVDKGNTQNNWQGITSLATAVVALPVMFIAGIFALPLFICGIVFGHMGLSSAKKGTANNRGLALGGLITSYSLLALGVLVSIAIVLLVVAVGTSDTTAMAML